MMAKTNWSARAGIVMWSHLLALGCALLLAPAQALAGAKEKLAALAPSGLVLVMDETGNELVVQNARRPSCLPPSPSRQGRARRVHPTRGRLGHQPRQPLHNPRSCQDTAPLRAPCHPAPQRRRRPLQDRLDFRRPHLGGLCRHFQTWASALRDRAHKQRRRDALPATQSHPVRAVAADTPAERPSRVGAEALETLCTRVEGCDRLGQVA